MAEGAEEFPVAVENLDPGVERVGDDEIALRRHRDVGREVELSVAVAAAAHRECQLAARIQAR